MKKLNSIFIHLVFYSILFVGCKGCSDTPTGDVNSPTQPTKFKFGTTVGTEDECTFDNSKIVSATFSILGVSLDANGNPVTKKIRDITKSGSDIGPDGFFTIDCPFGVAITIQAFVKTDCDECCGKNATNTGDKRCLSKDKGKPVFTGELAQINPKPAPPPPIFTIDLRSLAFCTCECP